MLIVCPNCTNSYEVAPEKLGPAGRSVRCVRCRAVWFAAPPAEVAPAAAETAPVPETAVSAPAMAAETTAPEPGPKPVEGAKIGWTSGPEGAEIPASEPAPSDAAEPLPDETEVDHALAQPPPTYAGPVLVSEEPAPTPVLEQEAPAPQNDGPEAASNIESLAARRVKRSAKRTWRRWRPGLPVAVVALVAVMIGLVAGRQKVVRFAPQTASLYSAIGLAVNLRGLAFENVKTTREMNDGVTVLVIEGSVVSVANKTVEVPRLRFGVRNAAGLEVYAWTTALARTILPPGESVEFRSRLASPPADARDVVVRFFNRRDVIAGIH